MAAVYPYIQYACPCTNINEQPEYTGTHIVKPDDTKNEDEDQPFNLYSPRAKHAVYPLDELLFCNDCQEVRCPRCSHEEALAYYCPNCLWETSIMVVKNETNR